LEAIVNDVVPMDVITNPDGLPRTGGYPRKRARTRRQLLDAGMAALAAHGPDGVTVGDVTQRAQLATGTFYNHFASLQRLLDAVTDELASGVEIARDLLDHVEHDPAARVAIGTRQLLDLPRTDPNTARAFVALVPTVPVLRARVRATVGRAVDDGIRAGRFVDRSTTATADALLGTVLQWMRARLHDEAGPEPDEELLRLALTLVGLPEADAPGVLAATTT
jgi:AcrR family transcriptional regulator